MLTIIKVWLLSYYFVNARNITMVRFLLRKCGRAFIHSVFFSQILGEKENHKFGLWLQGLLLGLLQHEGFVNDFQNRICRIDFDPIRVKFQHFLNVKSTNYFWCWLIKLVLTFNCPISGLCSALEVDKWSQIRNWNLI